MSTLHLERPASPALSGLRARGLAPDEVVSPELALVDPELARRARLSLPDPGSFAQPRAATPVPRPASPVAPPRPARRRTRRVAALAAAYAVAFGGVGSVLADVWDDDAERPSLVAGGERAAAPARAQAPAPAPAPAAAPSAPAPEEQPAAAATPVPVPAPEPAPAAEAPAPAADTPAAPAPAPAPATPRAAPAAEVSNALAWPAVDGATNYRVELFRGDTRVVELVTDEPRLDLPPPARLASEYGLAAGTYEWVVSPIVASPTRYEVGKPILRSRLVLRAGLN